jgi:B12-binding domain/radical SAM domain protein of rhizo-twelve system
VSASPSRVALVNPPWSFDGSIYFGCRAPHLPLEFGYARQLLEEAGHEARIFDAQLLGWCPRRLAREVEAFAPTLTAVTTAPSYLFWRCAPPELRVPLETLRALEGVAGTKVLVGPHGSTTPRAALHKTGVDVVAIGECEELLVRLAGADRHSWGSIPSLAFRDHGVTRVTGGPHASDLRGLPPLRWTADTLARHAHHHHRFDAQPEGPGAELEASRGCPYHCTFCAKENYRNAYRKRPLEVVLAELDGLIAQGVAYVYFIDEIFLPDRPLLEAIAERDVLFGVQMRVDNWSEGMLDLLARAGCVSIEAGVESITPEGRNLLDKRCKASTEELSALLVHAKKRVPFVQANLLESKADDPGEVTRWREHLQAHGVWANEPVPLFPYPGSPDYARRWGPPEDDAWERAHAYYLEAFSAFSDIQDAKPLPLAELERAAHV